MTQPPEEEGLSFLEPDEPAVAEHRVDEPRPRSQPGARRAERGGRDARAARRGRGCLPAAIGLIVVLVVLAIIGRGAVSRVHDMFAGPADYSGAGTGTVVFQVHTGDSAVVIGQNLKAAGVVESVDAFTAAARSDSRSRGIQVGYYDLHRKMSAKDALGILVDPKNLVQAGVTVPEGARVRDVVKSIVAHTKISRASVVSALEHPARIGLPTQAGGNPEGYLFPATYAVAPHETAVQLLREMVGKADEEYRSLGIAAGAKARGLTPEQIITVASILEYEASRDQDYPKVARAIYNRLAQGMPIQSDATVSYANGISGQIWTTASQRQNSSPYNTYQHTGLPPGPIGNPGVKTLEAAMHPANGPWLYWVVVNLRTGETVMSTTLAQHEQAVQQFRNYCKTSTAC